MGKEMRRIAIGAFVSAGIHVAVFSLPLSLAPVIKLREVPGPLEVSMVVPQQIRREKAPPEPIEIKRKKPKRSNRRTIKPPTFRGEAFVQRPLPIAEAHVRAHYDRGVGDSNMERPGVKGEGFVQQALPMAEAHAMVQYEESIIDAYAKRADRRETSTLAVPRYQSNPVPRYPEIARRRGYEGTVRLEVNVLASGRVGRMKVRESSGYRVLDKRALHTVKKWRFIPAKLGDVPVNSTVIVPINFQLKD